MMMAVVVIVRDGQTPRDRTAPPPVGKGPPPVGDGPARDDATEEGRRAAGRLGGSIRSIRRLKRRAAMTCQLINLSLTSGSPRTQGRRIDNES